MEKYFKLNDENSVKFGVITNIPDGTTDEFIGNILSSDTIELLEESVSEVDIEFELDWEAINEKE